MTIVYFIRHAQPERKGIDTVLSVQNDIITWFDKEVSCL